MQLVQDILNKNVCVRGKMPLWKFEAVLYSAKIGYIVLLIALSIIASSYPDQRAVITDYPSKHPGPFVVELFLLAICGTIGMVSIGVLRGVPLKNLKGVAVLTFIVCGILHILQQYSGMYDYSYTKPSPKMNKTYISILGLGVSLICIAGLFIFYAGLCTNARGKEDTWTILFLSALIFGVSFSIPYLLVGYNRDHTAFKDDDLRNSTLGTILLFSLAYMFLYYPGVIDNLLKIHKKQ